MTQNVWHKSISSRINYLSYGEEIDCDIGTDKDGLEGNFCDIPLLQL